MNCFAHVISRNLVKCVCKLNDEGNYAHAKNDLIKIGDLAFERVFLRALDSFRIKHADEKEFLDAFEKECLNHKGC